MTHKNPQEILAKYQQLANDHGLIDWSVRFLRKGTYRCYGLCNYNKKELSINREFCEQASEEEILDVMLHELAHALCYYRYYIPNKHLPKARTRYCGHSKYWKRICVEIGADPSRLYEGNVTVRGNREKIRKYKYALVHEDTCEVFHRYMKRPRRNPKNLYMRGRRAETFGKMKIIPIT